MNPHHILPFHYFRRFLEAAAAEGIDVAPLKGAHMCVFVYDQDEDRGLMSDVDFLVRRKDWARVCALLARQGYRMRPFQGRPLSTRVFHEYQFVLKVAGGGEVILEPHRGFIQPAKHFIDYNQIWERSTAATFDGAPCRVLCPEDHAAHACLSLETDAFDAGSTGFGDLEHLIRAPGFSWPLFEKITAAWGISKAAWFALSLLRLTGRVPVPAASLAALAPSLPIRLLLTESHLRRLRELSGGNIWLERTLLWGLLWPPGATLRYIGYYAALRTFDALLAALARHRGRTDVGGPPTTPV